MTRFPRALARPVCLLALALALVSAGCGTWRSPLTNDQSGMVAADFVRALSVLRGHSPRATTLQLRPSRTAFARELAREFRLAGYGIQAIGRRESGPRLVTYEAESYGNGEGESVAYRLRVGKIELGREYEIRGARVFPVTALSVRGVTIDAEPLDPAIFDPVQAKSVPERDTRDDPEDDWLVVPTGPGSAWTGAGLETRPEASEGEPVADGSMLPTASAVKRNYLELGRSNFASLLEPYEVAERRTLVFRDDSLRLGSDNKAMLAAMVGRFDPTTDVVSVMGCSHGGTQIPNGNEYLATGRANRVKEALIILGVEARSILEEGCWAGEAQAELPSRGVIVTRQSLDGAA